MIRAAATPYAPLPLPPRGLRLGTFTPAAPAPEGGFICLARVEDDVPLALFGPARDNKSRYVAQVCDARRVLPGTRLGVVPGDSVVGQEAVALVDELGRPFAFTGPKGDDESERDAFLLLAHPAFQDAVEHVRNEDLLVRGEAPDHPPAVAALLAKGAVACTPRERDFVIAWVDRHWTRPWDAQDAADGGF